MMIDTMKLINGVNIRGVDKGVYILDGKYGDVYVDVEILVSRKGPNIGNEEDLLALTEYLQDKLIELEEDESFMWSVFNIESLMKDLDYQKSLASNLLEVNDYKLEVQHRKTYNYKREI